MTNEQIAEVMGWGNCDEFSLADWGSVKEMQSRMVTDGYLIIISLNKTGITISAESDKLYMVNAHTEPLAIVALFEKIYGEK